MEGKRKQRNIEAKKKRKMNKHILTSNQCGARCSSMVRAFAHGAMGHQIDPSWSGPTELFLVPASAP